MTTITKQDVEAMLLVQISLQRVFGLRASITSDPLATAIASGADVSVTPAARVACSLLSIARDALWFFEKPMGNAADEVEYALHLLDHLPLPDERKAS